MDCSKVNDFRISKGIGIKEFAYKLGFSVSFVSKIICGNKNPSANFLLKIKEAYPDTDMNIFFS